VVADDENLSLFIKQKAKVHAVDHLLALASQGRIARQELRCRIPGLLQLALQDVEPSDRLFAFRTGALLNTFPKPRDFLERIAGSHRDLVESGHTIERIQDVFPNRCNVSRAGCKSRANARREGLTPRRQSREVPAMLAKLVRKRPGP